MKDAGTALELVVLKAALAAVIHHLSPRQCLQAVRDLDELKTALERQIQAQINAPTDEHKKTREVEEASALRGLREIQDQLQAQARQ